jgi:hypothetical protein
VRRVIVLLVMGVGLCGAAAGAAALGLMQGAALRATTVVLGVCHGSGLSRCGCRRVAGV